DINVTYPYFIVCLFSAGIHSNEGSPLFYWGQSFLIGWALWPFRARRFKLIGWTLAFMVVVGCGFQTQFGIRQLQRTFEAYNALWIARFFTPHADPAQSMTAIGHIGQLKLSARIVIRLHVKKGDSPPVY